MSEPLISFNSQAEVISAAIQMAMKSWLDDNRDTIIDAIAKHAASAEQALPRRPRLERKRHGHVRYRHPSLRVASRDKTRGEVA